MRYKIPQTMLRSKYRRDMWRNAKNIVQQLDKVLPIQAAYLMGSFTTKNPEPADIDFIILLQVKEKNRKSKWSVDLVVAPNNPYGHYVLKTTDDWVKKKYGLKKSTMVRLK